MTGVVLDPSGAVVAGAKVTVTDSGKGFVYRATTDAVGRYLVRPLPPATYQLVVESAGFKRHLQENIVLNVNQAASLDVGLSLGTDKEVVEVTATAGTLATQDAVTGQELNRNFVGNLPLLGRGVFDLAGLAPGITQVSGGFAISGYANNFISNGSRNATTDILIDGVTTTNYEAGSGIKVPLITPSVDSVQEFRVQQSNFSAEIGFTGSTVINVVSRSGNNELHGSGYWYLRNNILTANNWFANASGTKMTGRHYNDYGGTLGGPIRKNKIFYFLDYERLRDVNSATYQGGVPSAKMRAGDFAEICAAGFSGAGLCKDPNGQLWDPYAGAVYVPELGGPVRTVPIPFNNMATYTSPGSPVLAAMGRPLANRPGNLIDPAAAKMMQAYPLPNVNVGNAGYNRFNNWLSTGATTQTGYQGGVKIDHAISEATHAGLKYSRQVGQAIGANPYGNVYNPTFTGPAVVRNQMAAFNLTRLFGPRTLLTLTAGFVRDYQHQQDVSVNFPGSDAVKDLGLPEYMRRSGFKASPAVALVNYASPMGVSVGSLPYAEMRQGSETWDLSPSISRMQGAHDLKAGLTARVHRMNFVQPGAPGGIYPFYVNGTSQYPLWGGGDDFASFLAGIGVPSGPNGQYDIPAFVSTQSRSYGAYVQDNWRVSDRLTVNLGIRYEIDSPRTERHDRQSFIDLDVASPLKVAGYPSLKGGLQFVDSNNRSPYGWDRNNWAPRVGLAYRMGSKTVLRTGYGIFYSAPTRGAAGTGAGGSLGYSRRTNWIVSFDGKTPWARLSDPYPITGPLLPEGSSPGAMSFVGDAIYGPMRQMLNATPYEQAWSFGVQREGPFGILLDGNYVGKKGTKLYYSGSGEFNHLGRGVESLSAAQITDLNTMVANPFAAVVPAGTPLSTATIQKYKLSLPYPQFTSVSSTPLPTANSIYQALQVRADKRFSHGLQFLASYTWARSMDDSSAGAVTWLGGWGSLQNPNDRRAEHSLSQFDIPHIFVFSYVYDLPLGRGKAFGRNWNSVANAVLGGWKTNGIWRFSAGQPLALRMNGSQALPTYGTQRPNLNGTLVRNTGSDWKLHYFANPSVATAAAPYTLGNAPRTLDSVRAPGVNSANLSLFKYFDLEKLRPGARVEFRSEFFNAFNHPQFCGPNTAVNGSLYGQVTSTCTASREIQLALRLQF
ncbi:MAG: TonB-dependent receptor [Acidobacteria bacterium]|nr:TonB-dependent receptor [Acidobacteriota bacterium]